MDATKTKRSTAGVETKMGKFFGNMYSFNNSLKLFHWHITGKGSYAQHMALDQALETLADAMDRIVETTYALKGNIDITIPQTDVPSDIIEHCQTFFEYIDKQRDLFEEDFTAAILDDYQEAIQQLLYRLKRLQ